MRRGGYIYKRFRFRFLQDGHETGAYLRQLAGMEGGGVYLTR